MKKIESIIESCKDCGYCQRFNPQRHGIGSAFVCELTKRLITVVPSPYQFEFPDWCPLETYKEESAEAARSEQPNTVILRGLPHLEWMTENLTGFGGTEIDGRTYYTWDEAEEAVKQLGNGWRIPNPEEWQAVADLGSVWQKEGPHGLPGRLFGGGLFLDAAGYRTCGSSGALTSVGDGGWCWSSSPYATGSIYAGYLYFSSGNVHPLNYARQAAALSVRCVRNVK